MRPALLAVTLLVSPFLSAQEALKPQAVALVKEAIKHLRSYGKEALVRETNVASGRFHAKPGRDLYIFVFDLKGHALAHGMQGNMVNINRWDSKDPDGTYFVREFVKVAQSTGSGWVDYKYIHPRTQRLEGKTSYVELAEGLVIGCGIYK